MRRYISIAFLFILALSLMEINSYQTKPNFSGSYQGQIKDIRHNDKSYNIYLDNIVISNFGEAFGFHLGDEIAISGEFQDVLSLSNKGFGTYLKGRGASYIINSGDIKLIRPIKDNFSLRFTFLSFIDQRLDKLYGEFSYFPKALFYGYTMDKDILESFRLSGTSHILALSGFHVGFIVLFLNILLLPIGIRFRTIIMCLILMIYAYITGSRASIIRSVAFFLLYYLAFINKRRFDTLIAVMLISSVMMALNPFILYDMGFVLSFMCVASIFMFNPILNRLALKFMKKKPKGLIKYIYSLTVMTICAQILPLPYMIYNFGKIALLSVPANVLVLPLISLIMTLVILSLAFSSFFSFARLFADLGVIIMNVVFKINSYIAGLSFANKELAITPITAITLTLMLLVIYVVYENWRIKENKYEL